MMTKLKAARLSRQWNQTMVAYKAAIAPSDVSRIETLRMKPYPAQAARLARVLGLHPDELQDAALPIEQPSVASRD